MKKVTLLLVAIGFIFSCEKLAELIQANFDINPNDIRFTVNRIDVANSTFSINGSEYINVDSLIKSKESRLSINNIKEAKISKIELIILNHIAGDIPNSFKNLKSLKVELSTDGTNFETIKELSSADLTNESSASVSITPAFDVLAKVKASKNFTYKFTASNIAATTKDIEMSAKLTYSIKAGL